MYEGKHRLPSNALLTPQKLGELRSPYYQPAILKRLAAAIIVRKRGDSAGTSRSRCRK
jgi:hypothetical protein